MPSLEHNGIVEMFRDKPSLAPHLIEMLFHDALREPMQRALEALVMERHVAGKALARRSA